MFRRRKGIFWNLVLTMLLLPVFGVVPDGGGGTPDKKKEDDNGSGGGNDDGGTNGSDGSGGSGNGGNDDGGKDKDYVSRDELRKVVEQRDKAKDDRRKLEKQIDELRKAAGNDAEIQKKLEQYDEMTQRLADLEQKEEERKKADMTEIERLQHDNKKLQGKIGELQENADKTTAQLKKEYEEKIAELSKTNEGLFHHKLRNEIASTAAEKGAINPEQIVTMLEKDFKRNEDGDFVHEYAGPKGGIREMSVADRVEKFLSDKNNANLISAKQPRKGSDPSDSGADGSQKYENKLTANDKRDAKLRGMDLKEYYEAVVAPREKKMQEIAEKKKKERDSGSQHIPGKVHF